MDEAGVAARLGDFTGLIVAVGDVCSHSLIRHGIRPGVVVYDHLCMRAPVDDEIRTALDDYDGAAEIVANPAGIITDGLFDAVRKAVERGTGKIFVEGEEDLAALVAIMVAPDGAIVLYGQPGAGIVLVEIDERKRGMVRAIYERMVSA